MNTSAHGPNTADARGDTLRGSGASKTNSTPTDDSNVFLGSIEEHDKAMIHDLNQREKDMNTVLISAAAITLSHMRWVVLNIRSLYVNSARQAGYYQGLDAAVCSHMSRRAAASHPVATQGCVPPYSLPPHPAPDLPLSGFMRVNMYWSAGLVFGLLAMCLAMFGKQVVRSRRQMLVLVRQDPVLKSLRIWDLRDDNCQRWFLEKVIDGMYRSFQVALVVCFLGHVDAVLMPIGLVGLVPVVVWGTLYVLSDSVTNTFP